MIDLIIPGLFMSGEQKGDRTSNHLYLHIDMQVYEKEKKKKNLSRCALGTHATFKTDPLVL